MIDRGYLVGGAPMAGKTHWAESQVAGRADAVSVCTDRLAVHMMRKAQPEDYPNLFYTHGHDAESFYATYDTPEKAVEAAILHGMDLEDAIRRELANRASSCRLLILEGVAMTPGFARRLQAEFRDLPLLTLVFYDDNPRRIAERIRARGLWDHAGSYPEHIAAKEVAYVLAYNAWFRSEATRHGCLLAHTDTLDSIRVR